MKGQTEFIDEGERRAWAMDFYKLARQKLEMTNRWNCKQGILANILLLTPAECEKLVSAMNCKIYWVRADKNAKTKRSLIAYAKALLEAYNRFIDSFMEHQLRVEHKKTMKEIFK
ncbi:MAG: hypothetical protein V1927_00460 [Candidatus Omnitrophota bacterium]